MCFVCTRLVLTFYHLQGAMELKVKLKNVLCTDPHEKVFTWLRRRCNINLSFPLSFQHSYHEQCSRAIQTSFLLLLLAQL